jgi:hypothetical protein
MNTCHKADLNSCLPPWPCPPHPPTPANQFKPHGSSPGLKLTPAFAFPSHPSQPPGQADHGAQHVVNRPHSSCPKSSVSTRPEPDSNCRLSLPLHHPAGEADHGALHHAAGRRCRHPPCSSAEGLPAVRAGRGVLGGGAGARQRRGSSCGRVCVHLQALPGLNSSLLTSVAGQPTTHVHVVLVS